ncbi:hypothetical protein IJG72_06855 [bacterium]|nr:hypothetical protein [bacterium]
MLIPDNFDKKNNNQLRLDQYNFDKEEEISRVAEEYNDSSIWIRTRNTGDKSDMFVCAEYYITENEKNNSGEVCGYLQDKDLTVLPHFHSSSDSTVDNTGKILAYSATFNVNFKGKQYTEDTESVTESEIAQKQKQAEVDKIAESIHKDIYAKNLFGLPTTGKHIKEHVQEITKDNVIEVMNEYYKKSGDDNESLVEGIFQEFGLSAKDRANMVQHIESCLLERYKSMGVYVDDIEASIKKEIKYQKDKIGLMDTSFLDRINTKLEHRYDGLQMFQRVIDADENINNPNYQGRTGDCWLLSAINEIGNSPKGKQIINDSIKINSDNSITVHLKGVKKTYTFTQEELLGSTELSTGDMDIRALEKAVERYTIDYYHRDINGNNSAYAYEVLLGKDHIEVCRFSSMRKKGNGLDKSYLKKINDPNTICTAGTPKISKSGNPVLFTTPEGTEIFSNHAYSVVRCDDKYVYLINPWNNQKEIRMGFKDFKNTFDYYYNIRL